MKRIRRIKRMLYHFYQRLRYGFDDSEIWNLDHNIAKYVLPRLKRFRELNNSHPATLTENEWDEILDDMIYAMENEASDIWLEIGNVERHKRGFKYFGEYFCALWH